MCDIMPDGDVVDILSPLEVPLHGITGVAATQSVW